MNISFLKEKGNKYLIYLLLGALVLVLLIPTGTSEKSDTEDENSGADGTIEQQLEHVLSSMEGVGKVEVMISTEDKASALFGTEYTTGKVCGVVVVAEGAGNATVDTRICEAVKALFSIDVHKISIVKMKSQEEER